MATQGEVPQGLGASLSIPSEARAIVIFARASGSNTSSARTRYVADRLNEMGCATLIVNLLTPWEDRIDIATSQYRFDVELLAQRLVDAAKRVHASFSNAPLPIGFYGFGTGAAAAIVAAARHPKAIYAIVSHDGRPDLAGAALPMVTAPTLLAVSAGNSTALARNLDAQRLMRCANELRVVAADASMLAAQWFERALVAK